MGRNRREHHRRHRGTGAFIQRKLCRDNVGRNHLPAGADSNLQGPASIRREAEIRQEAGGLSHESIGAKTEG